MFSAIGRSGQIQLNVPSAFNEARVQFGFREARRELIFLYLQRLFILSKYRSFNGLRFKSVFRPTKGFEANRHDGNGNYGEGRVGRLRTDPKIQFLFWRRDGPLFGFAIIRAINRENGALYSSHFLCWWRLVVLYVRTVYSRALIHLVLVRILRFLLRRPGDEVRPVRSNAASNGPRVR